MPCPGKLTFWPVGGRAAGVIRRGDLVGGRASALMTFSPLPGRRTWCRGDRGIGWDYQEMVDKWDRLGVVVDKGTTETPFFLEPERDIESLGP